MATKSLTFMEAVKTCFKKYATFKGRARRSEFWWFYLFLSLVYSVFWGIFMAIHMAHTAAAESLKSNITLDNLSEMMDQANALDAQYQKYYIIVGIIWGVWGLFALIPTLAAWVRRLHDVGKSGHMLWLFFACGLGGLIPTIMCIADGQPGANQYGESPKYIDEQ